MGFNSCNRKKKRLNKTLKTTNHAFNNYPSNHKITPKAVAIKNYHWYLFSSTNRPKYKKTLGSACHFPNQNVWSLPAQHLFFRLRMKIFQ